MLGNAESAPRGRYNHDLPARHVGYFGYNETLKAYIEVFSFDRLLNLATERNRAFFDHLGLPVS